MPRPGCGGREMNYTATIRPTSQPELFSLHEEEPGGTRPDRMPSLSGPQERVQRRTVQQIVDLVPSFPTLDDPAPQTVEQLPDTLHFLRALSPDPEQAIEVPKILPVDVPLRTSVREPQLVEHLVEVPTIVSSSSLQRIAEQNVDIPVVGGSGTGGGLPGFLRGQNYSVTAKQIVDIPVVGGSGTGGGLPDFLRGQNYSVTAKQIVDNPVPRRSFSGDPQGFSPGRSSSKRTANKIADSPEPGGGPQHFPQTLHRVEVSSDLPDEGNQWVLALFPG